MIHRAIQTSLLLIWSSCLAGGAAHAGPESAVRIAAGRVDQARLERIADEPGQWLTRGRDESQTYYSPLAKIHEGNVRRLGFAWANSLGTTHGLEATPVVIDGVMYTSGPWGFVYALDALTGRRLWTYDPKVDAAITRKVCCDIVNRGLAVWKGRVYVGTLDGRLVALDAATGKVVWQADTIVDHDRGYTSTGAPYIAGEVVVLGNAGAEFDARGYVSAYDVASGRLAWRFFTVPGDPKKGFEHPEMEMASHTWDPDTRWEVGLGGTVWDAMVYDSKLDLIYIGVGNSALYPRKLRSPKGGDNLFVASIVAIHAKTGRMAWYYQTTPGDQWDYTATMQMTLADLTIDGRKREVLIQAPKNGFFYTLDRRTGELISAPAYVPVTWATHVDLATGRPAQTLQGDYSDGPKLVFPSPAGGHNWHPMSFNPRTGLVYMTVWQAGAVYWIPETPWVYEKGGINQGAMYAFPADQAGAWGLEGPAARHLPPLAELLKPLAALPGGQPDPTLRGFLRAWDPVRQRTAWQVETSGQWVNQMYAIWNGGGVMSTAGNLVFQGDTTGFLKVYAASDGRLLHSIDVGTSIMAAPMTYEVGGEQYVAVMAGLGGALGKAYPKGTAAHTYGNAGRIVAFKLDGGLVPKPKPRAAVLDGSAASFPRPPLEPFGTQQQIARGHALLKRHCTLCHSNNNDTGISDLRRMSAKAYERFEAVVLDGALAEEGMGGFRGTISTDDLEAMRAALLESAWAAYGEAPAAPASAPHRPDKP